VVVGPGSNGIVAHVILADGEFLPANLNDEKVIVYRRGESTNWELQLVKALGSMAEENLLRAEIKPNCNFAGGSDPLHQHEDESWWFYEETWSMENGPFPTYDEAYNALAEYCLGLEQAKAAADEILAEINKMQSVPKEDESEVENEDEN